MTQVTSEANFVWSSCLLWNEMKAVGSRKLPAVGPWDVNEGEEHAQEG